MWCRQCQQDVPGIPSGGTGIYACPRCRLEFSVGTITPPSEARLDQADSEAPSGPHSHPTEPQPQPSYDGWELEEQLRHIQRVLAIDSSHDMASGASDRRERIRPDSPHAGMPQWHLPAARESRSRRAGRAGQTVPWLPALIWLALSLGLMAFVCGGVLLGWSIVTGRQDLWTVGMPIALAGQVALLVGFILQLDRLWRDNRDNAAKLDHVDKRLHHLKTTTRLPSSRGSSAAGGFYSHTAGATDPQLLLADLKSQLDLLATRLNEGEH